MLSTVLIFTFMASVVVASDCPIQYSCNDTLYTVSEVENFCKRQDGNMTERCCSLNHTIIGLDLRYCGVKKLNISMPVFSEVEVLDLRDNDYDKFTSEELIGLLKLNFLYLPQNFQCPGGPNCWNTTSFDHNMTSCFYQEDPCLSLNISCGDPINAECKHTGPGSAKCPCNPGYYGYKCLNEGEFPVAIFSSSVVISTVVLSIALWFIQGRDPYKLRLEN